VVKQSLKNKEKATGDEPDHPAVVLGFFSLFFKFVWIYYKLL
jgi:hypothetical protein